MQQQLVQPVIEAVEAQYSKMTGLQADIYVCQPSAGAGVVSLS